MSDTLGTKYYSTLAILWGQESNRNERKTQLRSENVTFVKTIGQSGSFVPPAND